MATPHSTQFSDKQEDERDWRYIWEDETAYWHYERMSIKKRVKFWIYVMRLTWFSLSPVKKVDFLTPTLPPMDFDMTIYRDQAIDAIVSAVRIPSIYFHAPIITRYDQNDITYPPV